MNKIDSSILIDSIAGTLPVKDTNRLIDYFDETLSISYDEQRTPIEFLLKFKSNVAAEIHAVTLLGRNTNVERFRIELIDNERFIVQTVESNENLTVNSLTQVGIAAIRITYMKTNDKQAPRNVRLSIRGCFTIYPIDRQIISTTIKTSKRVRQSQGTVNSSTYPRSRRQQT
jgi:hypothetical protein